MHIPAMKWLAGIIVAFWAASLSAQPAPHTKASLILSHATATSGSTIQAAIHLKMDDGWHTYWKNPGDSGKATKIDWELPPGVTAGEIQWPIPEKVELDGLFTYAFHHEAALLVPLTIAPGTPAGPLLLKAKASWLECEKVCVPGRQNIQADLTIGPAAIPSPSAPRFIEWLAKIPKPRPGVEFLARWDGPPTAEERPIIFSITQSAGQWDFFNDPLPNFELKGQTETLPTQDGKIYFRKIAKKYEGAWPSQLTGLALISGQEQSASVVTASLADPAVPAAASSTPASPSASLLAPTRSLIAILGLAFIGGLILNIMPCVLPVIALKILGFVRQSSEDPKRIRTLGGMYALGVIVSFLSLAAFVILIKQAGRAASWGMQFQNPQFLILITILVTLVALNLFGVFEITLSGKVLDATGGLASREGLSGAFFNGVLATILATPCTAPFLGAALGFAFASSTAIILLTFLFVGLGLAAPYLVLCWFPAWLKKLPKPGAWMERFKIAMGFPMLATAIWLFSIAAAHFGKSGPRNFGLFLVFLGFAAWIFGEFVQRGSKRRGLSGGLAAAITLAAYFYFIEGQLNWRGPARAAVAGQGIAIEVGGIPWQPWSLAAVDAARAKGQPALVDFTADWCLTCQFNKKTSIEIPSVREKIKSLGFAPFLGDYTSENPEITAELQKYQRAGVPLVLVFPADPASPPIVLPEVLTPALMLDALEKAAAPKKAGSTMRK